MSPVTLACVADRYGLPLSTGSAVAGDAYIEGLDRLFALQTGAAERLTASAQHDEAFLAPHTALAFNWLMEGDVGAAHVALANGTDAAERGRPTDCELGRHAVVQAMGNGRLSEAAELGRAHLEANPRDALALFVTSVLLFLAGRSAENLALAENLASAYGDDWVFLGTRAFALHEVSRLDESESDARRALELRPDDASSVHSLAHVYYERGDHGRGREFLRGFLGGYDRLAPQHRHLWWHVALHELAEDSTEEVMKILASDLSPRAGPGRTLLSDASSLLWRLQIYTTTDDELPWEDLRPIAMKTAELPAVAFASAHAVLVLAALGERAQLDSMLDAATQLAAGGLPAQPDLLLAIADAATSTISHDWDAVVSQLRPVMSDIWRLGGSRAQREVFEDTLIVGCLRSGRREEAHDLLRARLARRPSRRDSVWLTN